MKLPTGQIHYILPGFIFKGTLLLSAYHQGAGKGTEYQHISA